MILTLLPSDELMLTQHAKSVTRFSKTLAKHVADMRETLKHHDGAGLAAPQVGIPLRIILVAFAPHDALPMTLINPRILTMEGETIADEGCLSLPGYVARNVPRADSITYEAQTIGGVAFHREARGWFARVIQHEIDHLDGILIWDRVTTPDHWQRLPDAQEVAA